jgi:hypothetical protein
VNAVDYEAVGESTHNQSIFPISDASQGISRKKIFDHSIRQSVFPREQGRRLAGVHGAFLNQPDWNSDPDEEEQGLCSQLFRRALDLIRAEFETRIWDMFWRSAGAGVATGSIAPDLGVTSAAVRQARSRVLRAEFARRRRAWILPIEARRSFLTENRATVR